MAQNNTLIVCNQFYWKPFCLTVFQENLTLYIADLMWFNICNKPLIPYITFAKEWHCTQPLLLHQLVSEFIILYTDLCRQQQWQQSDRIKCNSDSWALCCIISCKKFLIHLGIGDTKSWLAGCQDCGRLVRQSQWSVLSMMGRVRM